MEEEKAEGAELLSLQDFADFEVLPSLSPEQERKIEEEHRQRLIHFYGKNKRYEIDYWYPALAAFTYPSESFALTAHEAYVIQCHYYGYEMTELDKQVENNLIQKVDTFLQHCRQQMSITDQSSVFFMKLSTRSPKDNCWDYRDPKDQQEGIQRLVKYLSDKIDPNITVGVLCNYLYRFFLQNSKAKMGVRDGRQFLRIFSRSERIITDINDFSYLSGSIFEKLRTRPEELTEQERNSPFVVVWARRWENSEWSEQFRVFYNNYAVTAVTQYDQKCYFKELAGKKEQILSQSLQFFQSVKGKLQQIGLNQGVMDLIVRDDVVKLVQINVFDSDCRASLFNWKKDQQQLLYGPPTIRVLQTESFISKPHLASLMGIIEKNSTDVICGALDRLSLMHLWNQ